MSVHAAGVLQSVDGFLERLSQPLAKALDLPHLSPNFPMLTYSALGFTVIHVGIAPLLSRWLAPESYGKLKGRRARNNWCVSSHCVRLIHGRSSGLSSLFLYSLYLNLDSVPQEHTHSVARTRTRYHRPCSMRVQPAQPRR